METFEMVWKKGDTLKLRGYRSKAGKGLSYDAKVIVAAEDGFGGGWDVFDAEDGTSFYGFSVDVIVL
jgi:hypothetical protein